MNGDAIGDWYCVENANEISSPAILVYEDRIRANLQWMIKLAGGSDSLRPHVKTHKMPAVIAMKLAAGITRFKAATIAEAEMTAAAGGRDVLLAAQPVGPNLNRFVGLCKRFCDCRFGCLVDDERVLRQLDESLERAGANSDVWIDVNVGMDRTGIVPGNAASRLYAAMQTCRAMKSAGVHAYDGHLHERDTDHLRQQFDCSLAPFWGWLDELKQAGLPVAKLVAGGTPTASLWRSESVHRGLPIELGAGTTVLWDAGQPSMSPAMPFASAAILIARVISRPTRDRVCVDLGHKAVASEMPLPRVTWLNFPDAVAVMHNEEHMVLQGRSAELANVGDVLYGIPKHICPTVALHQSVWCVRDSRAVERWPVVARDRDLAR